MSGASAKLGYAYCHLVKMDEVALLMFRHRLKLLKEILSDLSVDTDPPYSSSFRDGEFLLTEESIEGGPWVNTVTLEHRSRALRERIHEIKITEAIFPDKSNDLTSPPCKVSLLQTIDRWIAITNLRRLIKPRPEHVAAGIARIYDRPCHDDMRREYHISRYADSNE